MKHRSPEATAQELFLVTMLVMRTVAAHMRRSRHMAAPPQIGMLTKIAAGSCTMSDLARHLAVSLPTVSKSIELLVKRGWVERWIDKTDRRQTMVRLTPSGRRILADVRRQAEQHLARAIAPLTTIQRARLTTSLRGVSRVLQAPGDQPWDLVQRVTMDRRQRASAQQAGVRGGR